MQKTQQEKRLIAVGDIHGQLDAFVEILQRAGLINHYWDWCAGHDRLLQIGDVFDRGPKALEADRLLDKLQRQAADAGGEVIRLVGNHELELLRGNFGISGFDPVDGKNLQRKLTAQVLDGKLRAAYAHKGYLFTHAGVTRKLYRIFQQQLDDANAYNLSVLINLIFKESIKHQFFKHPIFNISVHRKGSDRFGGIFWEDIDDLVKSFEQGPLWQVIGHTQVEQIIADARARVIAIDVGMHRSKEFLRWEGANPIPRFCEVR